MKNKNITTGNTGEWSELYALGFMLANGGVYGATKDQDRNANLFYKILKVIFAEKITKGKVIKERVTYNIGDEEVIIYSNSKEIGNIKQTKIKSILSKLLTDLSSQNEGRAFALVSGTEMMELLKKEIIKASSKDKKDLDLVLLDIKTETPTTEVGFSIKSQLGSPSTLINASKATNFIYEVLDKNGKTPKTLPDLHPKNVKNNISLLLENGYQIVFSKMESDTFYNNLTLIDSRLPEYVAKILLSFFSRGANTMSDLVEKSFTGDTNKQPVHKIKEFLSVMALGMMPNTDWDGTLTSLGGMLLVKKDGDVLCYYLYNIDDFRTYLLDNTKLDTPSTTRYGIGKIIQENGRCFIKLNLQVRFIK